MIEEEELEQLVEVFNLSSPTTDTRGVSRLDQPWKIPKVRSILEKYLKPLGIDTNRCFGDNFYLHDYEYLIHTDFRDRDGDSINVVVPLQMDNPRADQYLVVFDQTWESDGRTWALNSKKNYHPNIGIPGRPCDYPEVTSLSGQEIDKTLYSHLENIPTMGKDYFFGLTGKAFMWSPGSIITFNSKQLHCTGRLNCDRKMGIQLRFGL